MYKLGDAFFDHPEYFSQTLAQQYNTLFSVAPIVDSKDKAAVRQAVLN